MRERSPVRASRGARFATVVLPLLVGMLGGAAAAPAAKAAAAPPADPYAAYVWPLPPDEPRVKLEAVWTGRVDVEAESSFRKLLVGATPKSPYDTLRKPFAVAFDPQGRVLVTDSETHALVRFDAQGRKFDVLGTQGAVTLKQPLGLAVGPDGTIYVADAAQAKVIAYSPEGKLKAVYGKPGELVNPTDAAPSPDGKRLYVCDSKAQKIVIFDLARATVVGGFGSRGEGDGEFNFPTALAFGAKGDLFVVDQLNARVVVVTPDGTFVDKLGQRGLGFGQFVRPKDIAVGANGLLYVTDNAFNNVQIFDADFTLLTFVGEGGEGPGRFNGISGVAVQGDRMAVVDQLGRRLQLFRFLTPKTAN